jgi:hypothetical protein
LRKQRVSGGASQWCPIFFNGRAANRLTGLSAVCADSCKPVCAGVQGTVYAGGTVGAQAQKDLASAYNDVAGRTRGAVAVTGNIGG